MMHEHGNEFRVRIVHENETEELSGWMNCQEQIALAITELQRSPAKASWLEVRNILCLNCLDRELTIVEFPLILTGAENTRFPRQADRRPFGPSQAAQLRPA